MKGSGILLFFTLCACAAAAQTARPTRPSLPNVFLITIDTLRADHVHCYGDDKIATPAIDALAHDGVRFAQAFTPSPITNTSHTTILTGLLPSTHGVTDFAIPLSSAYPTWAELLHNSGYHTAAFIGAVILDSQTLAPGLDRGFDFYDNFPEHPITKSRWGRVERRGADVAKHAQTWLTSHPAGPHFVWLHLYDPHDPYEPPLPFSQTYKDRPYDGEIAYADSVLGNFISFLKAHGWYANALIVLLADHGEGLGDHHEDTHGIFLYDSTIHVPLIVKLPDASAAGRVVDAQVRTTDILPTVLDLTRIHPPEHLDGSSLRPFLEGSETQNRTAIGETDYPLRFGWAPLRSVRHDGRKFIDAPRPELYDLRVDPGELTNLYAAENSDVQKDRALLAALHPGPPAPDGEAANIAQSAQAQAQLTALGYQPPSPSNPSSASSALPDPKDHIEEQNLLHVAMLASEDARPDAARTALEKVLALNAASLPALRQLGELELQSHDYAKAAAHLKSARDLRPDDASVNLHLGEALARTEDLKAARDALEASLKSSPAQLSARILLGNVYLQLKDFKAAEDQFEAALLLQADSAEAKAGLAKAKSSSH